MDRASPTALARDLAEGSGRGLPPVCLVHGPGAASAF